MAKSPQKSPRPRGRPRKREESPPKGESPPKREEESSPPKRESPRKRESPPRRESPRKRQSLQETTTSAAKLNYDSSDSESDGSHESKGAGEHKLKLYYTDEFIASLTDMIEYYAEKMLVAGREERLELCKAFDDYWEIHPMKKHKFGRLHARYLLMACLSATCSENPYGNITDDGDEVVVKPMFAWSRDDWHEVKTGFTELRDLAVRKDTKDLFNFLLDDAGVQKLCKPDDVDETLDSAKLFTVSHGRLQKRFEIQQVIAPIRVQLERAAKNKTHPTVVQDDIDDIFKFLEDVEYAGVSETVKSLFEDETLDNRPQLKPWAQLQEVLCNKYFSLTSLQQNAEKLLLDWSREIFGELPVLMKMRYRLDDEEIISGSSDDNDRIQALKRKRDRLNTFHGEDPLEESRRIGARARGARVSDQRVRDERTRERVRKHARDSEDDEQVKDEEDKIVDDNEQEDAGPLELSGLPPRKKKYVKIYGGAEPDEDIFAPDGRVKKRRPFSDREIGALKKGVAKYGKGCWAEIKNEYAEILRNRTTVMLKDKWRTMERKGEDKED